MLRKAVFVAVVGLGAMSLQAAEKIPSYINSAVADSGRPAEDEERDANRKPAETVQFAGVKPGSIVVELVPGKGYFTRIFSKAVGPKGKVYAVSPPRRPTAAADAPDPSAATTTIANSPGYSNIVVQVAPLTSVAVSQPADIVFTAQNYHDVHNVPNVDIAAFNKSVFEALKPGGVFVVLDHAAAAGSGGRDTSTLHRIDPQAVKSEVEAAGFEFAGESKVLANAQDDHTAKVFDPAIRGKTDQFIFKFRKPGKK